MSHGRGALRLFNIRSSIFSSPASASSVSRQFSTHIQHCSSPFRSRPPIKSLLQSQFRVKPYSLPQHRSFSLNPFASKEPIRTPIDASTASADLSSPAAFSAPTSNLPVENPLTDEVLWTPPVIEEHGYIGFLKDLGIDFGWGPSSIMQWVFEHIHVYAGTPYWASVLLLAIVYRVAILRLLVSTTDLAARMRALKPVTDPLQAKVRAAAGNQLEMQKLQKELWATWKSAGVNPLRMLLGLVQIPFGFGVWRLFRGMADLPVPGLANGGALWFQDLSLADPLFVLPMVVGATMFVQFRMQDTNVEGNAVMLMVFKWVFPCLMPFILMGAPSIVQLSFAINGILALLTSYLLKQDFIRRLFGIAPVIRPGVQPTAPSTEGIIEGVKKYGVKGFMGKQWESVAGASPAVSNAMNSKSKASERLKAQELILLKEHERAKKRYERSVEEHLQQRRKKHYGE